MQEDLTKLVESASGTSAYNFSFDLTKCTYLADTALLYEYYKITSIQVVYQPRITEVQARHDSVATSTFVTPDMAVTVNPYSTVYSSYSSIALRGNARVVSPLFQWTLTFVPNPLVRAFDNAVNDGFLNMGPQWITTDRPDVPHYGLTVGIESNAILPPTPRFGGKLTFYYTVKFKNPRISRFIAPPDPPLPTPREDGEERKEVPPQALPNALPFGKSE